MNSLTTYVKRSTRPYLRTEVLAWAATTGLAIATALATAFLLSGCAAGIDPQSKPLAPEALATGKSFGAVPDMAAWPHQDWWKRYRDPGLDHLVEEALAGSPSLQLAHARLAKADAVIGQAQAHNQPSLGLDASSQRGRFSSNYIYPPPLGGSTFTTNRAFLNFGWDIDFWGKNRAAIGSARSQAKAAEADAAAARLALSTAVARAWFQLQRLDALHDVTEAAIHQREDILALTRQRVLAGLDTNVELREAESALPQARLDLATLDENIGLARNQIAALLGQGPDAGLAIGRPAAQAGDFVALPVALPASLVGRRPDLVAARWRVEAASHGIDYARAQFYPDLNLVASLGVISLGYSKFLTAASENTQVGPALTLPIYQADLKANLRVRDADYDAAVAQYNQTLIEALHDVADQITSLLALRQEQSQQQQAQAKIEEAYALAVQRYKAGLGNYLVVLTAQTAVLQQRRTAAELKARTLDLDVSLVRALGGGYDATPTPVALR